MKKMMNTQALTMYGHTGSKAPRDGGTLPNTVEYSPFPPSLSGAQNTSHCNYQPTLTAGRLAQQGGGSFRPYNHPPPAVGNPQSKAAATLCANQAASAAPTASAKSATPTSMLGCAVQSATTLPRQCACRGMLAPRKIHWRIPIPCLSRTQLPRPLQNA